MDEKKSYHETLDPENWDEISSLAHEMVDDCISYLQEVRKRPVWQAMPDNTKGTFQSEIPELPQNPYDIYREVKEDVFPYVLGNTHPRFWGWYMGNGTVMGALADLLTSILNPNAGKENQAATHIESQVLNWFKKISGMPAEASGIIVSGGSMANFIGLAVARQNAAGPHFRKDGLLYGKRQYTFYASSEVHSCCQKAIELMGIGSAYFRKIKVDENFVMDLTDLKSQVAFDREKGYIPACIIGTAGTVNTGSIDPLDAIADICQKQDIWFHVDGAIGAIATISSRVKKLLKGIERADSIAMDLHKWLHIPFEAGCCLVRNEQVHYDTFNLTPEYLAEQTRGISFGQPSYKDFGIQLSRRMSSLKIWMSIKEHGAAKYARMIDRNCDQAIYLRDLISESPELEIMAPVTLDIVCYRYNPGNKHPRDLDKINQEIVMELQTRGWAVPSSTILRGIFSIRVAISNHRSSYKDFDFLVEKTLELGREYKG